MSESQDHVRHRLDQLIRNSGESYAALSRRIGRNPAYIQQFIKRGVPRHLSERDRQRIARHFRVSEQHLGGPAAETCRADVGAPRQVTIGPEHGQHELSEPQRVSVIIIPFLDRPPTEPPEEAWAPSGFVLETAIGHRISGGRPADLGALVADGDSMAPTIQHGDYVLFDTAQQGADRNGLFVLQGPRSPMIRRIAINPVTGRASIIADNPGYPAFRDCEPDAIPVIGRIIWTAKPLG